MSDLVERIRNRANDAPLPTEYLLDEAADRVAALEAENAALREAVEEWVFRYYWRAEGMNTEQARIHAKVHSRAALAQPSETKAG